MNSKLYFILIILTYGILGASEARAALLPFVKPYIPQLYAGVSLGVQRLTGRRNEYVLYDPTAAGGPIQTIPFSENTRFSNNNGCYSAHIGFTWDIPDTLLFFGSEIYLGRGSAISELKKMQFDIDDLKRELDASIRQLTFWGGTLQFGVNCPWNSKLYLLAGVDKSQFEYSGTYIPRSQKAIFHIAGGGPAIGPDADYPSTILNTRKWLRGLLWGFGVEKQIKSIRVGADIRIIHYKAFNAYYPAQAFEPEALFSSFKPQNIRFNLKISYIF